MAKGWTMLSCAVALLALNASAQQPPQPQASARSAADVLSNMNQQSAEVERLRAALRGPDASVRAAAFSAMFESNNAALATIAITEGRVSSDAVLHDLAVRAAFSELQSFMPEPVAQLSAEAQSRYLQFTGQMTVKIKEHDRIHGTFKALSGGGNPVVGQISAGRLSFTGPVCQGNLTAVDNLWTFKGFVNCVNGGLRLRELMRVQIR